MVLLPGCACCSTCYIGTLNYIDIELEIDSALDQYTAQFTYTNVNRSSPTSDPVTTISTSPEYKVQVGKISKTKFRLLYAGVWYLNARPAGTLYSYETGGRYINVGVGYNCPTTNACIGNSLTVELQWVKVSQEFSGLSYWPIFFSVTCDNAYSRFGNEYAKGRSQTWFRPQSSNTGRPSTWPYVGGDYFFAFGSSLWGSFSKVLSDGIVVTDDRLAESVGTVFPTTLTSTFGLTQVDSYSCVRETPKNPVYLNNQYTLAANTNMPEGKSFTIPNPDPECILTSFPVRQFGCKVSVTIHSITLGTPSGEQNLIIDGDYGSLGTGTWVPSSPTVRAEVVSSA
jgi:hypothetical protein